MMELFQHYPWLFSALMAGVLSSLLCAVMGTWIVVNRIVFLSAGISHAAYGGIGLAFFFCFDPLLGAFLFSIFMAFCMGWITMKNRARSDTVIGVLWAVGMGLGVVLIDMTPKAQVDLHGFLFGSISQVTPMYLKLMLVSVVSIITFLFLCHRPLLAMSYDEEYARTRGVRTRFLYFFLLILTAVSVVILIHLVGLILVMALMTIGPYMTEGHAKSLSAIMAFSFLWNLLFVGGGLVLSLFFHLTSGPAIVLVAGFFFFIFVFRNRNTA